MNLIRRLLALATCAPFVLASSELSKSRILKHSDVVFMYQANRETYAAYGATAVAWGGKPTPDSLRAAGGMEFFGSVGMVTEFARYYERFPQTYEQGLCRDVEGKPVKVPWLTDHRHKGVPFWWCCTQQSLFRQYVKERVVETIKAGANGLHIDDHLGSAGGLWLGLCFCDRCVEGFQTHLVSLSPERLKALGVGQAEGFHYREVIKAWQSDQEGQQRRVSDHPFWEEWTVYQCRAAARFMEELRELAAETAGRSVPIGANAGLLWPRHLSDYRSLDLFSAETDHQAGTKRFSDRPLVAYRMADAMDRPYAATASGGDWAFIKEQNLPGLVCGWIALSYAAGQHLMVPHRQWCHTPEKGTHWYQGPAEKFAPLYRFVRRYAELFDDYGSFADVGIVLPHRAFMRNPGAWFERCDRLSAKNVAYRLLVAGDEIVDHPLVAEELFSCPRLLVPDTGNLSPSDRRIVEDLAKTREVYRTTDEVLAKITGVARIKAEGPVRALARAKPGAAVVHLLNYEYDAARDSVTPTKHVVVRLDLERLGVAGATECELVAPDADRVSLPMSDGIVEVPRLGLWGILVLEQPR